MTNYERMQIENPNDKTLESSMTAYNKAIDLGEAYLNSPYTEGAIK